MLRDIAPPGSAAPPESIWLIAAGGSAESNELDALPPKLGGSMPHGMPLCEALDGWPEPPGHHQFTPPTPAAGGRPWAGAAARVAPLVSASLLLSAAALAIELAAAKEAIWAAAAAIHASVVVSCVFVRPAGKRGLREPPSSRP